MATLARAGFLYRASPLCSRIGASHCARDVLTLSRPQARPRDRICTRNTDVVSMARHSCMPRSLSNPPQLHAAGEATHFSKSRLFSRGIHTCSSALSYRADQWHLGLEGRSEDDNVFGQALEPGDRARSGTAALEGGNSSHLSSPTVDPGFMQGGLDCGRQSEDSDSDLPLDVPPEPESVKRRRGRPRQSRTAQDDQIVSAAHGVEPTKARRGRKVRLAAQDEAKVDEIEQDGEEDEMWIKVPRPKPKSRKRKGIQEVLVLADLPGQAQDSFGPLPALYDQGRVMSPQEAETRAWAASLLPKEMYALENPPQNGWNLLAKDILTNMVEHPGCILLTRVGSFYEAYMSQAQELARLAGLRCAKTIWRGLKVDMAGFPCAQLPKYIDLLVRTHRRLVALCDEFILSPAPGSKGPGTGKYRSKAPKDFKLAGLVQVRKPLAPISEPSRLKEDDSILRRVTEIISPGTLVDDSLVDPYVNNFLLAISVRPEAVSDMTVGEGKGHAPHAAYGLAWLDLGTSMFSSTTCPDAETLRDEVARISPREIVLPDGVFGTPIRPPAPTPGPVDAFGWPSFPPPPVGAFGEELPYQRFNHPLWEVVGDSRISFVSSVFAPESRSGLSSPVDGPSLEENGAIERLKAFLSRRFLYRPDGVGSVFRPGEHPSKSMQDVFSYLAIPAAQRQNTDMRIDAHTLGALEVRRVARGPQDLFKPARATALSAEVTAAGPSARTAYRPTQIAPPGSGNVGSVGSLLHAVRRTLTRGGARLLERWLVTPSTNGTEIHRRHEAVSFFLRHAFLSADLRLLFKASADVTDVTAIQPAKPAEECVTPKESEHQRRVQKPLEGLLGGADPIRAMIKSRTASSTPETLAHVLLFLQLVQNVRLSVLRAFPHVEGCLDEPHQMLRDADKPTDDDLAVSLVRDLDPLPNISSALAQALMLKVGSEDREENEEPTTGSSDPNSDTLSPPAMAEDQTAEPNNRITLGAGVPPIRLQIRPEPFPALSALVVEYNQLKAKAMRMEAVLRQRLPASDQRRLSLRTVQGRGPIIWVDRLTNSMASALGDIQADSSGRTSDQEARWHNEPVHFSSRGKVTGFRTGAGSFMPWNELSGDLASVREAIRSAEDEVLTSLAEQVWKVMPTLRTNATAIDQLDVMLSFAALASERALVRPQVYSPSDDFGGSALPELDIRGVRHLVVEAALEGKSRAFTPNDVVLTGSVRAGVITGPNMGGKSTVLRAVAHAVILAQAGSFVPASFARLGIVDGLFARVGARDALWNDQSTFMLEMLETAHFLTHATRNSLVIADEIGRGTTAETGLAIAHATLSHLTHAAGARTLFATHFHPIVALLGYPELLSSSEGPGVGASFPSVSCAGGTAPDPTVTFWYTDAQATPDGVVFNHRLRPGVNTNSYGLVVARLAGVPPQVVQKAQQTLDALMRPIDFPFLP